MPSETQNAQAISFDDALALVRGKSDAPATPPVSFDEALKAVRSSRTFSERLKDAAIDMPVGMVKTAGRLVQMVPGVTAATDAMYGLPAGASAQSMQPANTNQKVGGYLGDLALTVATGGAEAGGPVLGRTVGYVSNPTVAQRVAVTAGEASKFGADTINSVKAILSSGGPVTPEKVAGLIVKYGKDAVRAAVVAGGGYGAWSAIKHLL